VVQLLVDYRGLSVSTLCSLEDNHIEREETDIFGEEICDTVEGSVVGSVSSDRNSCCNCEDDAEWLRFCGGSRE